MVAGNDVQHVDVEGCQYAVMQREPLAAASGRQVRVSFLVALYFILFTNLSINAVSLLWRTNLLTLIMAWRNDIRIKISQTIRLYILLSAVPAVSDVERSCFCHGALHGPSSSWFTPFLNTSYNYITTAVRKSPGLVNQPFCNYQVHTLKCVTDNWFLLEIGANGRIKHCITKLGHIVASRESQLRPQDCQAPFLLTTS